VGSDERPMTCPCNKGEPHMTHCGSCRKPLKDRAELEKHRCGFQYDERRALTEHAQAEARRLK